MVKKFSFIITILIFCVSEIKSQEDYSYDNEVEAGFAAVNFTFNMIDKDFALFTGGNCGFIVKKFRIGAFFGGLSSNVNVENINTGKKHKISCSYGGVLFGREIYKQKSLVLVTNLKFLIGRASTKDPADKYNFLNKSVFYGVSPEICLEYYFNDYVSMLAGIDYKYCFFQNDDFYSKSLMNVPGIVIGVRLGVF